MKNGLRRHQGESFIYYLRKIFQKKLFLPPDVVRTCAYQVVRSVSFSDNSTDVLNGWSKKNIAKLCTDTERII